MKKVILLSLFLFSFAVFLFAGKFGESVAGSFLGSSLSNVMWELPRRRYYGSGEEAVRAAMDVARNAHTIAVDAHRGAVRFESNIRDLEETVRRLQNSNRDLEEEMRRLRAKVEELRVERQPAAEGKKRWWWPF